MIMGFWLVEKSHVVRTDGWVFSGWEERFLTVLERKLPGLQIEKSQNRLETGERVGGHCMTL